ncbi:Nif3-like dinuclear metal center hexameric protein [Shewanella xiamenensis]|uniref:Nif3-like dinuclear metal center hexameric protein n=1 Tax=Shewanella xiamenensis TaxID=332186 RepID=UPI000DB20A56|nr:Nif3-like dinuclear metal center hexameric protein [Shewanella xiamenensis]MCT8862331.1 Nif3-like dinuclear metal center hexameric protein [Shewanella xiamenensis]MCT8876549.1 Nif3-like dinuclear metal center hexameric protein [Shewanella xiamenensis]PZP35935.1 MAG: Nif3-like dinuclear metal center hexameric protein [Shewanella oneidensis]
MTRTELTQYLADFLRISAFKDYAPNGLQVEGKADIRTIVTGVTACQALIDEAIRLKADAILVHHGFFWKSEPEVIIGMKQRRIKALLAHDINLFGYHLPLDAHPMLGNNAVLGRKLGIIDAEAVEDVAQGLVWRGKLDLPVSASEFAATLDEVLGRAPLHIGESSDEIQYLAWCTGGAQDYIDVAASLGVDAFISGEVSERTFHSAVEQGIHYYAAGHHATERFGIEALGRHLAREFNLVHHFVDIANPV